MFAEAAASRCESLDSGVAVTELLMAAYLAAETETVVKFPVDLDDYVPAVATREWYPRAGAPSQEPEAARV